VEKELGELKSLMQQEDHSKRNLQERVGDLSRKSNDYQKLINDLSGEVQRLNEVLRTKLQECSILENKSHQLAAERDRLQAALLSEGNNRSKLEDYENKFALISLEIERLNSGLKNKIQEKNEVEQQVAIFRRENEELRRQNAEGPQLRRQNEDLRRENEDLRRQIAEVSSKVAQGSQEKLEDCRRQLEECRRQLEGREEEMESLSKTYDLRIQEYLVEIQRLNQILKLKLEEIRQREGEMQRLEAVQMDTLKKLEEAKGRNREVADMERLNNLLRLKVEEAARWELSNQ
jgi:chromosome segregation ATPase